MHLLSPIAVLGVRLKVEELWIWAGGSFSPPRTGPELNMQNSRDGALGNGIVGGQSLRLQFCY